MDLFVSVSTSGVSNVNRDLQSVETQAARTDKSVSASLGRVGTSMKSLGSSMTRVGGNMTAFVSGPVALIGGGLVKLAADAEETGSKFRTVFGKDTANMSKFITDLQKTMPATSTELQGMTAELQDLLIPIGVAPKKALEMTKGITTLTGDLASFNNLSTADVARDVQAALTGEYDSFKKYGVALSATTVEQKAMNMGLANTKDALTAADKAQAAYAIILDQTKAAQGDMARTANSSANSFKFLWREVKELGTSLGKVLLPVLTPAAQWLTKLANRAAGMSQGFKIAAVAVGVFVAAIGPLILGLGLLLVAVGGIIGAAATLGTTWAVILAGAAPVVAVIAALAVAAVLLYKNWNKVKSVFAPLAPVLRQVKGAMASVVPIVKNLGAVIKGLFTGNTGTEAFKRSFASLPGPVQKAVKLIVIAWRGLKTSFSQAWAQIKPILTQIGNGIKTGLGTAFKFLVSQAKAALAAFRAAWPGIKSAALPVIMAVANGLKTVLGAAFKFALSQAKVVVNWFKANWPLIQKTAATVMGILVARVKTGFNLLKAIIWPIVKAIVAFWKANWDSIRAILVAVWNIIKTTVQTGIKTVLNVIKLAMQLLTGDWRGAWQTIKNILRDAWNAMKSNVGNVLKILGNIIKIAWDNIKAITLAAFNIVRDHIKNKIQDAKDRAVEIVKALGQAMFDRYESMKTSAKAAFEAIRDFIANPIEAAVERVRSAIDAIKSIVGGVLEAFGQDNPFQEKSPGGNGSGGRGSRPARVARFARGGLGTSGRQPRTHMWNEQMGNEAFIAEREPSKTQMPYLKTAAGWHGMDVVPRRSSVPSHRGGPDGTEENPTVHKHARGGISGLPYRAFAYGGFGKEYFNSAASALDQATMSRFPVDGSSYSGHPAGAVDFLVSSGQAQGQEKALGDSVAGWLDSNYEALNLRALIWYAKARYEGGAWQPYVDNYGGGSGDVASQMHYNHPHAESLSASFGKLNEDQTKGFTGGGGGIGGMIKESLADQMWNGTQLEGWKGAAQQAVLGAVPIIGGLLKAGSASYPGLDKLLPNKLPDFGGGILAGGIEKFTSAYKDSWVKDWIYSEFGGGTGPGGNTGSFKGGGSNREIGEKMLNASGVPGSFSSLDSLWTKESQWDENAQNPTSTAYGIPQFLQQTWDQYGGKTGVPSEQIDKGLSYISDRYGSTDDAWGHSQANNWYSRGGMTNGAQRAVIGEAGRELVIPLENRAAMQASRNAMGTTEISERLESLERALVAKLDRVNLDTPSANHIVTGGRNRVREVMKSTEGKGIIQTQNREIDKTQSLRRGR